MKWRHVSGTTVKSHEDGRHQTETQSDQIAQDFSSKESIKHRSQSVAEDTPVIAPFDQLKVLFGDVADGLLNLFIGHC